MEKKIPRPVIKRLGLYYRCLNRLYEEGIEYVASKDIAERLGIKSSQVRKDLSYFGEFGKRGVGYNTYELMERLEDIIGVNKYWNVIVIGAGNIGSAIANYEGLRKEKFNVIGIFDADRSKVGRKIGRLIVKHFSEIDDFFKKNIVEIAVLAVPENAAQMVVDKLEELGIKGIVNFAPVKLRTNIPVEDVDITLSFKSLSFKIERNIE
ncbi:redox-sensing transcriptional repressor Rex [Thermosipho africanus Ob7]|jgi:redox-sensing transcriptional repressor|uniref:Redox-sensing transcriptional repressor Rex n=1 Tax=Thermosipho africanus (strain TCF52B) TaxID=484019 RepID=REX_THEAB|nr:MULTISPECIES: redox-sensing transcriptional repressor Rex [Thermosipho]B7IDQ7.1 RecName: Full=Redox-sensing transcriptional repressor Rex [Thermosipho africanus TCF52B]ACJ76134.1 redox-sensing transcriptional repressor rex 1 [Thermosipho africanus TCF52B]MBZ4649942.1 redox-sensing transcriptional repressor rex 1 [Thermosipho sp. (in: thermotogales)]MDK2839043.1 redox-sensing transcriptional repressor [Thermosipho sp. (in: thermotogales)]RDI92099.1 redox-sensing transcriptional repressor Rex